LHTNLGTVKQTVRSFLDRFNAVRVNYVLRTPKPSTPLALWTIVEIWGEKISLKTRRTPSSSTRAILFKEHPLRV